MDIYFKLFDLFNDPHEFRDLGEESSLTSVRAELHESIFKWQRNLKTRTEVQTGHLELRGHPGRDENVFGIKIGHW